MSNALRICVDLAKCIDLKFDVKAWSPVRLCEVGGACRASCRSTVAGKLINTALASQEHVSTSQSQ